MNVLKWLAGMYSKKISKNKQKVTLFVYNRAMMKSTDGDFGKFVNTMKKPRDNA